MQELKHITIMANSRQGGAFGFLRKSIGSVTYSTIKDGKGKRIQVARSKPVEVANPNTVAQIIQRMKVKPAARFFNAFAEILDNAFEGMAYGPASRRHFMGLAMSLTGPYIPKGATRFIPAKYPVSEGALAGLNQGFITSAKADTPLYEHVCFAAWVGANDGAIDGHSFSYCMREQYGDDVQVTLMAVTQGADGTFEPHYGRFLTSDYPTDTVEAAFVQFDGFSAMMMGGSLYLLKGSVNSMSGVAALAENTGIVAAAVIISKKEGENWSRTNTIFSISAALEVNLYGQEAMAAAVESYQSAQGVNSLNSSWYLNLANGQPFYGQLRNMNYTLEFEGPDSSVIQRDVVIPIGYVVNENGALRSQIPADADGNLIVLSNGSYTTMADPSDGAAADAKVKVADVYLQITGTPTTYLWKEAYAIQITA